MAALLEESPVKVKRNNPITKSKLTVKQAVFVKEYIKSNGNGTQSALKAYKTTDYNTAHVIAAENILKPTVKEAIEAACGRLQLTPDRVLGRLNAVMDQDERTVAAAQVINQMTGWIAPTKQDLTFRVGAPEHGIVGGYCE